MFPGGARERHPGFPVPAECLLSCDADVETAPGARIDALLPPPHEPVHEVLRVELWIRNQAVGQCQRHAGVVGPLPWLEVEGTATRHLGLLLIGIARHKLDRGAESIADGQAEQCTARAVKHIPGNLSTGGRREHGSSSGRTNPPDIQFLGGGLYGTRPCLTDLVDCLLCWQAELDQQPASDCAGAAEATPAVQQDVASGGKVGAKLRPCGRPGLLEGFVRHVPVDDRQVVPPHGAFRDGPADPINPEPSKLVLFHKRNHCNRTPVTDAVEVHGKVAVPVAAERRDLLLAGTECHSDEAANRRCYRIDPQWM